MIIGYVNFPFCAFGDTLFSTAKKVRKKCRHCVELGMRFGCESSETTLTSLRGSRPTVYSIHPIFTPPSPKSTNHTTAHFTEKSIRVSGFVPLLSQEGARGRCFVIHLDGELDREYTHIVYERNVGMVACSVGDLIWFHF